jgi:hypothetical protein
MSSNISKVLCWLTYSKMRLYSFFINGKQNLFGGFALKLYLKI